MGSDQVLAHIARWQATQCDDMSTMHEEAAIVIVQQIALLSDL